MKYVVEFFLLLRAVVIRANLNGSEVDNEFRGFMIQARPSENGAAFGAFRLLPNDNKSKLFGCPDNTTPVRTLSASSMRRFILELICRTQLLTEIPILSSQCP